LAVEISSLVRGACRYKAVGGSSKTEERAMTGSGIKLTVWSPYLREGWCGRLPKSAGRFLESPEQLGAYVCGWVESEGRAQEIAEQLDLCCGRAHSCRAKVDNGARKIVFDLEFTWVDADTSFSVSASRFGEPVSIETYAEGIRDSTGGWTLSYLTAFLEDCATGAFDDPLKACGEISNVLRDGGYYPRRPEPKA
jgi:hypothetical protein